MFTTTRVELPLHDADVEIVFPGGKVLLIQVRPSNADTNYNGSLDIILPTDQTVANWIGDNMQAAPQATGGRSHERVAKQLVTELPGLYPGGDDYAKHVRAGV